MEIEGVKNQLKPKWLPIFSGPSMALQCVREELGLACTEQCKPGDVALPTVPSVPVRSRSHRPSIRKQCNEAKGSSQWITGCKQGVCRFLRKEQYKRVIIQSGSKGNSSFTTTIDIFPRKYIYLLQVQITRLELIFINLGAVTKLLLLSGEPSQMLGKH